MSSLTNTALVSTSVHNSSFGGLALGNNNNNIFFVVKFACFSGGKAGVSTIENNHDFSVALAALLKKTKVTSVQVEFDVEAMDGYQIQKWVC
jgi:hypothetical protein